MLIPILQGLSKEEIISHLPAIIELPTNVLKIAIQKILHKSQTEQSLNPITPSDVLVALHLMDIKIINVKKIILG